MITIIDLPAMLNAKALQVCMHGFIARQQRILVAHIYRNRL